VCLKILVSVASCFAEIFGIPNESRRYNLREESIASFMCKRLFDILLSTVGLVLLSPILWLIAIRIRCEDGGSVFYRGERVARAGKPFAIYKFRTMVVNADKLGASSTTEEDPRITTIGGFLRKYKLDELPQLINVFLGQMSIVGPRPEVKKFTDLYSESERRILSVRPGITDWASIWNSDEAAVLAGAEDPDGLYMEIIRPKKLKLQMDYVDHHNFWIDLKIITLTLLAILGSESAAVKELRGQKPGGGS